jgi:transglutaminase-like putative cysteine protease
MKRLTLEAIHSQLPRQAVHSLLIYTSPADPPTFAAAVRNWILTCVDVVDEYEELLQSPAVLIAQIARDGRATGDCDDVAMLSASLLASLGAHTRFAAVNRAPDGSYEHVFVQYRFPRMESFVDFDPTLGYTRPEYDVTDMIVLDVS